MKVYLGINIFLNVIIFYLKYHVLDLVLNVIGFMGLFIRNGIVYEYVIRIEILNGGCVCYNNKRITFYRDLS